jgi:hypothetical protein
MGQLYLRLDGDCIEYILYLYPKPEEKKHIMAMFGFCITLCMTGYVER